MHTVVMVVMERHHEEGDSIFTLHGDARISVWAEPAVAPTIRAWFADGFPEDEGADEHEGVITHNGIMAGRTRWCDLSGSWWFLACGVRASGFVQTRGQAATLLCRVADYRLNQPLGDDDNG